MIFVGIDIASDKHDATIISEHGVVLSDTFTFSNDSNGFKKLHMEITSHTESLDVCIGMEETGIYHNNIANFFFDKGFSVFTINASKIHHFIKSTSLRSTKTDKTDSLSITNYLMLHYLNLNSYTPSFYNNEELKSLSRLRFKKLKYLSMSKTEIKRLLMVVFPEFVKHFNPFSKWALNLFLSYKSIDKISNLHLSTLSKIIKTKSNRDANALLLKQLAKSSIGNKSKIKQVELLSSISDLLHYKNQIDIIDEQLASLMKEYSHITSIPGVGIVNGAAIIGEIGDPYKFNNKSKVLAFAGCDPSIYQSGKYLSNHSRLSKRGSKYLRSALFSAARVASVGNCKDNKFREKYLIKISQGKHHYTAVFHVAKNMLYTIYSIMKSKEAFNNSIT